MAAYVRYDGNPAHIPSLDYLKDNPYPIGGERWVAWNEGWEKHGSRPAKAPAPVASPAPKPKVVQIVVVQEDEHNFGGLYVLRDDGAVWFKRGKGGWDRVELPGGG